MDLQKATDHADIQVRTVLQGHRAHDLRVNHPATKIHQLRRDGKGRPDAFGNRIGGSTGRLARASHPEQKRSQQRGYPGETPASRVHFSNTRHDDGEMFTNFPVAIEDFTLLGGITTTGNTVSDAGC